MIFKKKKGGSSTAPKAKWSKKKKIGVTLASIAAALTMAGAYIINKPYEVVRGLVTDKYVQSEVIHERHIQRNGKLDKLFAVDDRDYVITLDNGRKADYFVSKEKYDSLKKGDIGEVSVNFFEKLHGKTPRSKTTEENRFYFMDGTEKKGYSDRELDTIIKQINLEEYRP